MAARTPETRIIPGLILQIDVPEGYGEPQMLRTVPDGRLQYGPLDFILPPYTIRVLRWAPPVADAAHQEDLPDTASIKPPKDLSFRHQPPPASEPAVFEYVKFQLADNRWLTGKVFDFHKAPGPERLRIEYRDHGTEMSVWRNVDQVIPVLAPWRVAANQQLEHAEERAAVNRFGQHVTAGKTSDEQVPAVRYWLNPQTKFDTFVEACVAHYRKYASLKLVALPPEPPTQSTQEPEPVNKPTSNSEMPIAPPTPTLKAGDRVRHRKHVATTGMVAGIEDGVMVLVDWDHWPHTRSAVYRAGHFENDLVKLDDPVTETVAELARQQPEEPYVERTRRLIEEQYRAAPTGCGASFGELLCYEIHTRGLTFSGLAAKWNISLHSVGELIADHCKRLADEPVVEQQRDDDGFVDFRISGEAEPTAKPTEEPIPLWTVTESERLAGEIRYTIRSGNRDALDTHRNWCQSYGWDCDQIAASRGLREDLLPARMWYFRCNIPIYRFSQGLYEQMVRWDRQFDGPAESKPEKPEPPTYPALVEAAAQEIKTLVLDMVARGRGLQFDLADVRPILLRLALSVEQVQQATGTRVRDFLPHVLQSGAGLTHAEGMAMYERIKKPPVSRPVYEYLDLSAAFGSEKFNQLIAEGWRVCLGGNGQYWLMERPLVC